MANFKYNIIINIIINIKNFTLNIMNIYIENKRNYIFLTKYQYQYGGSRSQPYQKISKNFVPTNLKKFKEAFKEPFEFIVSDTKHKKHRENIKLNNNHDKQENESSEIMERYSLNNISVTMFDENWKPEKINLKHIDLDNDIRVVYMYQEGEHDIKPWYFIGLIENTKGIYYVYYEADCDYTGFDCQGSMTLYISKYLDRIIRFALPENVRTKFYKNLGKDITWIY
jgi:hypothetical protein